MNQLLNVRFEQNDQRLTAHFADQQLRFYVQTGWTRTDHFDAIHRPVAAPHQRSCGSVLVDSVGQQLNAVRPEFADDQIGRRWRLTEYVQQKSERGRIVLFELNVEIVTVNGGMPHLCASSVGQISEIRIVEDVLLQRPHIFAELVQILDGYHVRCNVLAAVGQLAEFEMIWRANVNRVLHVDIDDVVDVALEQRRAQRHQQGFGAIPLAVGHIDAGAVGLVQHLNELDDFVARVDHIEK